MGLRGQILLFLAIIAISFFWSMGAVLAAQFPPLVKNSLGSDQTVATLFLAVFSIGVAIGSVAVITPHVKGGKLRAIAVTGQRRSHALPEVITLSEQGFPGFLALAWWGMFAPAGTPKPILDKLHAELVKALNQADVRKTLTETLGMDLVISTPDALQKFLLAEMARWGKVVKDYTIRPD